MGELYIAEKAKGFNHKAEKEHAEKLSSAGLLAAIRDLSQRVVRFEAPGTVRLLEENRNLMTVIHGTSRVGEVDGAGTKELRALLSAHPELGGMVTAKVVAGPDWSGTYEAAICILRSDR
jgi:hypothetical protein